MSPNGLKGPKMDSAKKKAGNPKKTLNNRKKLEETFKKMNGYYQSSGTKVTSTSMIS